MNWSSRHLSRYSLLSSGFCLFFLLNSTLFFAQKNLEYQWEEPLSMPAEIPPQFEEARALFIEKKLHRAVRYEAGEFSYLEVRRGLLYLKTAMAIERYARIYLPLDLHLNIFALDARVLHQDGSTEELNPNDFKRVFDGANDLEMVFEIQGVQAGDLVEWIVKRKGGQADMNGTVFFYDEIPVLKSIVQLDFSLNIELLAKNYNGLADPKVHYRLGKKVYEWTSNNIAAFPPQTLAIPALSLPFFTYNIALAQQVGWNITEETTWLGLLESIYNKEMTVREGKPKVLGNWYTALGNAQQAKPTTEQVKLLHQQINKQLMVASLPKQELNRSLSYYLEKGYMDRLSLLKLYRNLLERFDLDFYLVIGKSRYRGSLDLAFPDLGQIGELFFMFKNEDGKFRFLYPKTNRQFSYNKLPSELEGTTLFLYNPRDPENLSTLKLPYKQPGSNRIDREILVGVDLETVSLGCSSEEKYTGTNGQETAAFFQKLEQDKRTHRHLSRQLRHQIPSANLTLANLEVKDLLQDSAYFGINYNWEASESLTFLDSNLIKINLNNWFLHDFPPIDFETQKLDIYPSFKGTDTYRYTLQFDGPVSLVEGEQLVSLKNENGEYAFRIYQATPTSLTIESRLAQLAEHIPLENFDDLKALKQAIDRQNALYLLVTLE